MSFDNLVLFCCYYYWFVYEGGYLFDVVVEGWWCFCDFVGNEVFVFFLLLFDLLLFVFVESCLFIGIGEKMDLGYCVDVVLVVGVCFCDV